MFTGIIEESGEIVDISQIGSNIRFKIASPLSKELKIDQSVSHDGVCLTVVARSDEFHELDLVQETLEKSKFDKAKVGDIVNLERSMKLSDRLDGHIVQGHVDQVGKCISVKENDGSWLFTFSYREDREHVIVEKGSICINGISLTAFDVGTGEFAVAIIPYTYEHTNMRFLNPGDDVNLEFDVIGKYVARITSL
ncbi:MAG: riboflavin synthase [Chitinophagales bacterium]|nr:riboflavin synthase [Chitinophagales bacterium]